MPMLRIFEMGVERAIVCAFFPWKPTPPGAVHRRRGCSIKQGRNLWPDGRLCNNKFQGGGPWGASAIRYTFGVILSEGAQRRSRNHSAPSQWPAGGAKPRSLDSAFAQGFLLRQGYGGQVGGQVRSG